MVLCTIGYCTTCSVITAIRCNHSAGHIWGRKSMKWRKPRGDAVSEVRQDVDHCKELVSHSDVIKCHWRFSAEKWHYMTSFKRITLVTLFRIHCCGQGWKQRKMLLQKSRWEMTTSWSSVSTKMYLERSGWIMYIFYRLSQRICGQIGFWMWENERHQGWCQVLWLKILAPNYCWSL